MQTGLYADAGIFAEDDSACEHLSVSRLSWPGATNEQLDIMRRVYTRQVEVSCSKRAFKGDVSRAELGEIEGGITALSGAAEACRQLLRAARAAMTSDGGAARVTRIGVVSGYRSASHQLRNWCSAFSRYYEETRSQRETLSGGPFGADAVALLTQYVSRRLAAPGFSLHNSGLAIDFTTIEDGVSLGADTSAVSRRSWRTSWFFGWLSANAANYALFQNLSIDEPWHWEFRAPDAKSEPRESASVDEAEYFPDTIEPSDQLGEAIIAAGRLELSNTPLLAQHRGTQPDLILRWNDMPGPGTVDVVVHFHGYSGNLGKMCLTDKERFSGLDFSDPASASGSAGRSVPTLGILPRGSYEGDAPGRDPRRYGFPALTTSTGLQALIDYSISTFQAQQPAGATVTAGRTILTAHSGGGAALTAALAYADPDEIYTFDALYSNAERLRTWLDKHIAAELATWTTGKTSANGGMCVIYRQGGTQRESLAVAAKLNALLASAPPDAQSVLASAYRVLKTTVDHGSIPRKFGWQLLMNPSAALSL